MLPGGPLTTGAVAVLAPRPAARPALAFLQLFLGSPNAALSRSHLLGILHPADELVAGQGRDVLPGIERRRVDDQRLTQVRRQLMYHPTWHSRAAHMPMVVSRRPNAAGPASFPVRCSGRNRNQRRRCIHHAARCSGSVRTPRGPRGRSWSSPSTIRSTRSEYGARCAVTLDASGNGSW
jgi:hypothetical protein